MQPADPSAAGGGERGSFAWWRWRWALLGIAISLPFHLTVLLVLAHVVIEQHEAQEPHGSSPLEVAILPEGALEGLAMASMPEVATQAVQSQPGESDPIDLPDRPVSGGGSGAGPLDGSGGFGSGSGSGNGTGPGTGRGKGDPGLGTGSGGTSFFGVRARGSRFGYVVDKSGSMAFEGKWLKLAEELNRSLHELPESANFSVVFFDTAPRAFPPDADGWERARRSGHDRFGKWAQAINPGGGTEPVYGFNHLLSLDVPPDAIFFMTDGEIPPDQALHVATQLQRRSRPIVIHCIQFQDRSALGTAAQRAQGESMLDQVLVRNPAGSELERLVLAAKDIRTNEPDPGMRRLMMAILGERVMRELAEVTGGAYRAIPVGGAP